MRINGSEIVARALKSQGVDTFFFIMGGPMLAVESAALRLGLRGVDVRHEQAARDGRARLRAPAQPPRRVHGRVRPGDDEPGDRGCPRLVRCRADPRPRRRIAEHRRRPWRVPGDRPAFDHAALHQMGARARTSRSASRNCSTPRSARRCRASRGRRISIFPATSSTRRWTRKRSSGRRRGMPSAAAAPGGLGRPDIAAVIDAAARRKTAGAALRQRHDVVRCRRSLQKFVEGVRHPVLHHAAGARRDPRGSRVLLPHRALDRVPRRRCNSGCGHAAATTSSATPRRRASTPPPRSCASTSTPARSPPVRASISASSATREPVLAQLAAAARGHVTPDSFRGWRERLRGQNAGKAAEQDWRSRRAPRRSIRCGSARRCATCWTAMRSCASTARRS